MGGNLTAENIVTGGHQTNVQYGDRVTQIGSSGPVTAGTSSGGDVEATREGFKQQLAELQTHLAQAIEADEFEDDYEAEDAKTALARVAEQAAGDSPASDKITGQLERATTILTKSSDTAQAAGKLGSAVIKLAPMAMTLKELAEMVF